MTNPRDCEQVRLVLAELATGAAAGDERAAALQHVAGCEACRQELAQLARAADELLLLAPEREPSAGFESRVLDRLQQPPSSGPEGPSRSSSHPDATTRGSTADDARSPSGTDTPLGPGQGAPSSSSSHPDATTRAGSADDPGSPGRTATPPGPGPEGPSSSSSHPGSGTRAGSADDAGSPSWPGAPKGPDSPGEGGASGHLVPGRAGHGGRGRLDHSRWSRWTRGASGPGRSARRRTRRRRVLEAFTLTLAFLLAAGVGVGATWRATSEDRRLAEQHRETLEVAGGRYLAAMPITASSGGRKGTAFLYQGKPSWLLVTITGAQVDGRYEMLVVGRDGVVRPGGSCEVSGGNATAGYRLYRPVSDVAAIQLNGPGGVRLTAHR